jgi:predicted nucleic acid-binding protein
MPTAPLLRVVIDTNVVFEGLTQQGGAAGLIIDAWLAGLLEICVSMRWLTSIKMFYL